MILEGAQLQSIICCTSAERAKAFYNKKLGLPIKRRSFNGFTLDVGQSDLCVCEVSGVFQSPHTVAGFAVADVRQAALELRSAGIELETHVLSEIGSSALIETPDGSRVGWFRDCEGNLLSVVEYSTDARR